MQVLPYKVGVLMVAFTKDRFKYANWLDTYPENWQPRKRKSKWKGKKDNRGRKVLTKSGRLARANRIVSTTPNSVTIGNDTPYASAHNNGLRMGLIQQVSAHKRRRFSSQKTGTGKFSEKTGKEKMRTKKVQTGTINVKAHKRRINQNIPRRRFMGESKYLNMQISKLIEAAITSTFRI